MDSIGEDFMRLLSNEEENQSLITNENAIFRDIQKFKLTKIKLRLTSSHAWRERDKKWAKIVIKITDKFQKNHCERANKREQPVVDLIIKKKLHQQTVGKQL